MNTENVKEFRDSSLRGEGFRDSSLREQSLVFKDVSFGYAQGSSVFQSVSCTIDLSVSGVLYGLNGTGKSTFLQLMKGLLRPGSGSIERAGHTVDDIGLVFQNPDIGFLGTTVEDDIAFGLLNAGMSKAEASSKALGLLDRFDLLGLKDRNPFDLSFGQKKMLSILAAAVTEPAYLCLDEPFLGLDKPRRNQAADLLTALETPVLITSHEPVWPLGEPCESYLIEDGGIRQYKQGEKAVLPTEILQKLG